MFSYSKHVCVPESSILNVWDILKPHNSLALALISKRIFDKQFQHLKSFIALLNVWAARLCNKSY